MSDALDPTGGAYRSGQGPAVRGETAAKTAPSRVAIRQIQPEVEAGRFPATRCLGDVVNVTAEVVADGHDVLAGALQFRHAKESHWREVPLVLANPGMDTWGGSFEVDKLGDWEFRVTAWVEPFLTWLVGFRAKVAAGQDVSIAREQGAGILDRAATRMLGDERLVLIATAAELRRSTAQGAITIAEAPALTDLLGRSRNARFRAEGPVRRIRVDPVLARCSAWYEFFPRSTGANGDHGTFRSSLPRLRYAAEMGFDVVYLPPIHPIGYTNRKGPNNSAVAGPTDPGSPWAIGSIEGGHRSVHPQLGTLVDFGEFLAEARALGIEVALDLAFQCAPDHPLVTARPDWFRQLPDGTIAHAENPPKRYEDIVPFDFECHDWDGLWHELLETTLFWVEQGVRVFRVDNPHTKPLPFWEWLIAQVRSDYPEVIFLAEAFARPALVHGLARRGFNQSYTYFAWRNTRQEMETYLTDLMHGPGSDYLRPNLWPNTPDILTDYLQAGGRPAAIVRLVLAATLSASYGIYGPAFELCEAEAVRPGSEEYKDSEKYQIRAWDVDSPWSLRGLIARINAIRRAEPALQRNDTLTFHPTTNDRLLCFSKHSPGTDDLVVVVANLDPHGTQSGIVRLDEGSLALSLDGQCLAADLLAGGNFVWEGRENYVSLDPTVTPAHIFSLKRKRRSERDFEYFF